MSGQKILGGRRVPAETATVNSQAPNFPLPFSSPTVIHTIYARTPADGGTPLGNGTLESPYDTFQRAILDVPLEIPPGVQYIVDITGIDETLPDDFTLPAWSAPGEIATIVPAPYNRFFFLLCPVNIAAVPELVPLPGNDATINQADCVVTHDSITNLITITLNVARPSWVAGDGIVGNVVVGQVGGPVGALGNAPIDSCDVTGKIITISNKLPFAFPLQIMRPSAHLHGAGILYGALNTFNIDSIAFSGLKIDSDVAGFGLYADGAGSTVAQMCVLDSPHIASTNTNIVYDQTNRVILSHITGSPELGGNIFCAQDFFDATFELLEGPLLQAPVFPNFSSVVFRGCAPVHATSFGPIGGGYRETSVPNYFFNNVLVDHSTGDGMIFNGVRGLFLNVDISSSIGNGITANLGAGFLKLENVGSTTANGGIGIVVDDGLQVAVDAATSGNSKLLAGFNSDNAIQVGSESPISWGTFNGLTPKNIFDGAGGAATGSRFTEK